MLDERERTKPFAPPPDKPFVVSYFVVQYFLIVSYLMDQAKTSLADTVPFTGCGEQSDPFLLSIALTCKRRRLCSSLPHL